MCINIYTRHLKKEANGHDFVSPTPRFREKSVVMSTEAPLGIGERGLELQNSMPSEVTLDKINVTEKPPLKTMSHKMTSCCRTESLLDALSAMNGFINRSSMHLFDHAKPEPSTSIFNIYIYILYLNSGRSTRLAPPKFIPCENVKPKGHC